jgi:dihydrofolate synthase/folylpolyglutamate synthase
VTSFTQAEAALLARGRGRMVPDLDRITLLLELLGQPQRSYPTIHVTGTNGKGSVVRMVAGLLSAAGVSAGTFTSPHLQTVRERLQVAGRRIGEQAFADLYDDVAPLAELVDQRSQDSVTYFELLTAMASWWFAEVPVDVGVFEVGMGGTWDATNLVRGDVAVLQPIDVDHSELGGTPVEVAREKAGIIKAGGVAVVADQPGDVLDVLRARADDVGAELRLWGRDHELLQRSDAPGGQAVTVRVGDHVVRDLFVPLFGAHQADNAVVAVAAVQALLGPTFGDLADDAWRQGLATISVPGRLEVVHRTPTVLLDGAHNPHGARAATTAVPDAIPDGARVVLVVGVLDDKDVEGVLRPWRELADHVVLTRPPSPRAASPNRLEPIAAGIWEGTGVPVETTRDVAAALDRAEEVAGSGDAVVVTGSLFTVGAARDRYLPVLDDDDDVVYEPEDVDSQAEERRFEEALDLMIDRVDAERAGDTVHDAVEALQPDDD